MRTLIFIAILIAAGRAFAVSPLPPPVAFGAWNGYVYELRYRVVRPNSYWSVEKEALQLSPEAAVAHARKGLIEIVGPNAEHFFCSEIRLERPGGLTDFWHYVVEFQSAHKPLTMVGPKGGSMWPKLHFVVYLDGNLDVPTPTKPVELP